jgi:hypothetical protein
MTPSTSISTTDNDHDELDIILQTVSATIVALAYYTYVLAYTRKK